MLVLLALLLGLEGTKVDHASVSSKTSATSSGSNVRDDARGTVILSDLRTKGIVVVVPGTRGGKSGQVGGSVLTHGESQVGACSPCYANLCRIHGTEEAGKATLHAGACRSRKARMGRGARRSGQVCVRTTTSRPRPSDLILYLQAGTRVRLRRLAFGNDLPFFVVGCEWCR